MRMLVKRVCMLAVLLISVKGFTQQLIQATIKLNSNPDEVEVWLKPNFSNTTQYLAQIGVPIAWPVAAPAVQPGSINVTLAPTFVANFGSNYTPFTINPLAHNASNTVNYFNIVLIRSGGGASNPQAWNAGQEFHLLTVKFPTGTPNAKVKVADFQDGGSDGQGYFYSADGNANYYMSSNSINNFYASAQSTVSGNASEGYAETNSIIPVACAIPSVSINSITNVSADVNWPAITGASGYEYAISTSSTPPGSGSPTTSTTFSPSDLTASTLYYVYVRTNCGGGSFSNWSITNFTTAATPCALPSIPSISNIGITTANINWNVVVGAAGYEYLLSTSPTTPGFAPGTGTAIAGTGYNANGLIGSTSYYIYVRTNCGSGNYSPWVSNNFTTLPPLCSPPSVPTFGPISTTTADINWNAVSESAGYEYVITTVPGTPSGSGTATSGTSFTATGLIPGTTYYIYVRNNCGGGSFSIWSSASFNTVCPMPAAVIVPTVTITSKSAIINWNATGASSYQYDISTSASPTTLTPSTGGTTTTGTSYPATGLASGITYYAYVRSICSPNNFSEWQKVSFATVCTQPAPATITGITPSTPTAANISWSAIPDANAYQYLVSTSNIPPQTGTSTVFTNVLPGNLAQGTQYYVHVRTECSPGVYSQWTTTPFVTVFPPCNPAGPLTINSIGNTVTFSWPPLIGIMGYEYSVTVEGTAPTDWVFVSGTSGQWNNLVSNTKYNIYLRAKCGQGRFSNWISKSFNSPCFKPSPFLIRNTIVEGTAELGWNAIEGAVKYEYAILPQANPPQGSMNFTIDTKIQASHLSQGNKYYFHVRTHCNASGVSEWSTLEFHSSGIGIYPNPVKDIVIISGYGLEFQNEEIALYDAIGRLLFKSRLNGNTVELNLRNFASGIYFIRYGKNKKRIVRVIKK